MISYRFKDTPTPRHPYLPGHLRPVFDHWQRLVLEHEKQMVVTDKVPQLPPPKGSDVHLELEVRRANRMLAQGFPAKAVLSGLAFKQVTQTYGVGAATQAVWPALREVRRSL